MKANLTVYKTNSYHSHPHGTDFIVVIVTHQGIIHLSVGALIDKVACAESDPGIIAGSVILQVVSSAPYPPVLSYNPHTGIIYSAVEAASAGKVA